METAEIHEVYFGVRCLGCGGIKIRHTAFCCDCYRYLPQALRLSLWKRFDEGFEQAFQGALSWFRLHPPLKSPEGQFGLFRAEKKREG